VRLYKIRNQFPAYGAADWTRLEKKSTKASGSSCETIEDGGEARRSLYDWAECAAAAKAAQKPFKTMSNGGAPWGCFAQTYGLGRPTEVTPSWVWNVERAGANNNGYTPQDAHFLVCASQAFKKMPAPTWQRGTTGAPTASTGLPDTGASTGPPSPALPSCDAYCGCAWSGGEAGKGVRECRGDCQGGDKCQGYDECQAMGMCTSPVTEAVCELVACREGGGPDADCCAGLNDASCERGSVAPCAPCMAVLLHASLHC